jgi:hypothetical protein
MRLDTIQAFRSDSFPCNPRPFAAALGDLCAERGTDAIRSDEAKAILWILLGQAYGQMATVSLCDEWDRLNKALPEAPASGCPECARANGPHYSGPCEHGA